MRELHLAVNLEGWRFFVRRQQDSAFPGVSARIFARDSHTCQYCGFQAMEYQQIVNADGNYANNRLGNMITACCFCAQCLFLESVGMGDSGGGQLIYLPEIAQPDLNSFCHVLFCAMGNTTGYQDTAQSIYRDLKFRSQPIEDCYGSGTSQPAVLGQLILEHGAKNPDVGMDTLLKDVRLLPSHARFRIQLDAWAAAALREMTEEA